MSDSKVDINALALRSMLDLRRGGNRFVSVEMLRKRLKEQRLTPEDIGSNELEIQRFSKEDCKWEVENDLENWRITRAAHPPGERCFAAGVCENLHKGGYQPEDFGITPEEMKEIRLAAFKI